MPVSFYEALWIFLIYAFLGWCSEVAYAALDTGKFVNRGFLNGPVCPIYGVGVLVVVVVLTPLKDNLLLLFLGSVVLTTTIEFVTGFLLEKLFHNQWWDYSKEPFNICGYVCLKFSILWGLACTFVMDIVHPMIYKLITVFPHIPGLILLIIFLVGFACDLGITVGTILKFNRHLRLMDEVAAKLKVVSDGIGENIYENVTAVVEKSEEFKETHKEKAEEFSRKYKEHYQEMTERSQKYKERYREAAELSRKYKELLEMRQFGMKRLLKAFPNMNAKEHNEILQKYREHLRTKLKGEKGKDKNEQENKD